MKNILLFTMLFSANFAQAKIINAPQKMKSTVMGGIESQALDAIKEKFGCQDDVNVPAKFTMTNKQLQEKEYAEYAGQLSSFTLKSAVILPASCQVQGKKTCLLKFDLYDEGDAFDLDSSTIQCSVN